MSDFTPPQLDEMSRLFDQWMDRSRLSTLVRQLQGATAGQIIAGMTFPAYSSSSVTATVTIPHGHAAAPLAVVATVANNGHVAHATGDATNLSVFAETNSGATTTGPVGINYVAVFEV